MQRISEPLYIHSRVSSFVKDVLVRQYRHPGAFDEELMPLRWVSAVFGRNGLRKSQIISKVLNEYNIPYQTATSDNLESITEKVVQLKDSNLNDCAIAGVLIIEKADALFLTKDETALMLGLNLQKELAQRHKVMIVCCCDRVIPSDPPRHIKQIVQQFTAQVYAPAPDATFRKHFLEWFIQEWKKRFGDVLFVEFEITPEDYESWAMVTTFTTPQQMLDFLRGQAYMWHGTKDSPFVVTFPSLEEHMSLASGTRHISKFDESAVESVFSKFCGFGTFTGKTKPKRKGLPSGVSGFTPSLVDPMAAEASLKKRKK